MVGLSRPNQNLSDTRSYDAFGALTSSTGTHPTPFGFAGAWGYQTDGATGFQLLGHRYYDPDTGRFLSRDPIRDGRNWYAYCDNNPLKWMDPDGLKSFIILMGSTSNQYEKGVQEMILKHLIKNLYKKGYNVEVIYAPKRSKALRELASADGFAIIGHGTQDFGPWLSQGDLHGMLLFNLGRAAKRGFRTTHLSLSSCPNEEVGHMHLCGILSATALDKRSIGQTIRKSIEGIMRL